MQQYDVSAVILFQNDEEIIGTAIARVADYLRERGLHFELLAVDVDSHDNSTALLTLLRNQHPELRVTVASAKNAFLHGATAARGEVVWFLTPQVATTALDAFVHAYARVASGERNMIVIHDRFALAQRARITDLLRGLRGHGCRLPRGLVNRARRRGLSVESRHATRPERRSRPGWLAPLVSMLSLDRSV